MDALRTFPVIAFYGILPTVSCADFRTGLFLMTGFAAGFAYQVGLPDLFITFQAASARCRRRRFVARCGCDSFLLRKTVTLGGLVGCNVLDWTGSRYASWAFPSFSGGISLVSIDSSTGLVKFHSARAYKRVLFYWSITIWFSACFRWQGWRVLKLFLLAGIMVVRTT